jgi:hypothetical protein
MSECWLGMVEGLERWVLGSLFVCWCWKLCCRKKGFGDPGDRGMEVYIDVVRAMNH